MSKNNYPSQLNVERLTSLYLSLGLSTHLTYWGSDGCRARDRFLLYLEGLSHLSSDKACVMSIIFMFDDELGALNNFHV